ncbi:Hypothetical protein FKW44_016701, partial [Caligus rogercresseyi]
VGSFSYNELRFVITEACSVMNTKGSVALRYNELKFVLYEACSASSRKFGILRYNELKFVISEACLASSRRFVVSEVRYTEGRYIEGLLY